MQHAQRHVSIAIVKHAVPGKRIVLLYDKQECELQHRDSV